mmetsp:Transcript_4737/g.13982  ORF Transcript_4737/g.13982 Transcript_4737/m.13982 type:complete len:248 (+) Transcript_4737:289-1032(+)
MRGRSIQDSSYVGAVCLRGAPRLRVFPVEGSAPPAAVEACTRLFGCGALDRYQAGKRHEVWLPRVQRLLRLLGGRAARLPPGLAVARRQGGRGGRRGAEGRGAERRLGPAGREGQAGRVRRGRDPRGRGRGLAHRALAEPGLRLRGLRGPWQRPKGRRRSKRPAGGPAEAARRGARGRAPPRQGPCLECPRALCAEAARQNKAGHWRHGRDGTFCLQRWHPEMRRRAHYSVGCHRQRSRSPRGHEEL